MLLHTEQLHLFSKNPIFFSHPSAEWLWQFLKFIYSDKPTKFYKIYTVDWSYVLMVKSKVEISKNFVAFSEYMNFNTLIRNYTCFEIS